MAGLGGVAAAGGNVRAPAGPARSIIGRAIAAHPNWNPHPGGAGSAGGAGLGAGALSTPQAPTAPAAPAAPAPPPAPGGSPLDATYYNDVNGYLFRTNNQIGADQQKIGYANTDLQTTLGNLAYQQPRDALALEQRANAGGGLYSSVYGQNQGNLQHSYATRQTAAQTAHDRAVNGLTTEIGQLQATEDSNSPTMLAYALASAQRAAVAAQNNPALGAQPPAPVAPVAPAAVPGSPAQRNVADNNRADRAQARNRLAQNIANQRRR